MTVTLIQSGVVNFVFVLLLDATIAEIIKKGNENSMRNASNVTASMGVSRYAIFTMIAFVEKQMAPTKHNTTPVMKYEYDFPGVI